MLLRSAPGCHWLHRSRRGPTYNVCVQRRGLEPADSKRDPESSDGAGQPVWHWQILVEPVEQLVEAILITVWYQALIFIEAKGPEQACSNPRFGMDYWRNKSDEHTASLLGMTPRDSHVFPRGLVW